MESLFLLCSPCYILYGYKSLINNDYLILSDQLILQAQLNLFLLITTDGQSCARANGHLEHLDGVHNCRVPDAILHKLLLCNSTRPLGVDFVIEALRLSLVSSLIVALVHIIAQQPVDCKEDSRQLVECQHIVSIQIVQSEHKVNLFLNTTPQETA